MKQPKIVLVEWVDSCSAGGPSWWTKEDILEFAKEKPMVCQSVGFVLYEDKHSLTLAQSLSSTRTAEHIKIPKVSIRWKRELKP